MRLLLILLTILDLALAALLVGVSGFILEGVNGGGSMRPEAVFFWLMLGAFVLAPIVGWWLWSRQAAVAVAFAAAPLVIAGLVLALEPLFV